MSRRRRRIAGLAAVALLALLAFLILTRPRAFETGPLPPASADLANGELVFRVGGCLACHAAPAGTPGAERALPTGGTPLPTPVGTFYPGNLTPDRETGLGGWTEAEFLTAMVHGVSPDRRHYFPAFPYRAYAVARSEDLRDLWAYLRQLPAVRAPGRAAEIRLLPLARRTVGLWKRLAGDPRPPAADPAQSAAWNRGAYLVHGPGHCGECHTPRNLLRIRDERRALAGGAHPAGEGKVPSLRGLVARHRYKDAAELALALQFGETLGYDKLASGGMGAIQTELSQLPPAEPRAIAEYLVSLP